MIVKEKIPQETLVEPLVKGACDIQKELVSIVCFFHVDCAEELVEAGSAWKDIWGFSIYPDKKLEYKSLINIRPKVGNRSTNIESEEIRNKIREIVTKFL